MPLVYLGLGSNMGNRRAHIETAMRLLAKNKINVLKTSRLLETQPMGGPPQAKYLNGAAKVSTRLKPLALLKTLKRIETALGRVKTITYGPRPIDIDILLYGNTKITSGPLTVPHPQIKTRTFVQIPLREILEDPSDT